MKLASLLFTAVVGLIFCMPGSVAAEAGSPPVLLAQARPVKIQDTAVTSINDQGAGVTKAKPTDADDTFVIQPTEKKDPETGSNLWKLLKDGGWAMLPLGALSIITVMLIIVYTFTLRRGAIVTSHFMHNADVLLKKRDYLGLLAISSRHSEVVARIVQRTLDFATKNPTASYETLREIAETEGGCQTASFQHRVTYLADIGVISPMIGLLGTVFGIISAFAKLGSGAASLSRDILLASGVSQALIATASGLVLGIFAMAAYGIFRNRVQSLISDMEIATTHVLSMLAVSYAKKREVSRAPVEDDF